MAASPMKISAIVSLDASDAKRGASEASTAISSIGDAAAGTETKMQRLIATATGLHAGAANGNQRAWTGALAAEGLALDNLRAKYNPLFAVIRQYRATLAEIRTAHAMGALSADEMTAAIQRQRQAALASIDVIKGRTRALAEASTISGASAGVTSSGGGNFAATNAMFQLQDVAMTAAMGMNPAMIALQQGSQLAGVFAGQTLKQTGSTLLSAFTQLLSPVALATVAVTGLSAAAIQYFTRGKTEADGMSAELREQADLIARVADAWGDATPLIKAYADEMEKAANARERLKAGEALAREQYTPVEDTLSGLRRPFSAAQDELEGYGTDAAPALKLMTDAVVDLQSKIMSGTATTSDLSSTQKALAETLDRAGTPAVRRFVDEFTKVAPQIQAAIEAARQLRQEGSGSIFPQLGQLSALFSEGGRLYSPEDFIPQGSIPTPTRRPLIELEGLPGAVEAEKALADAKRDRIRALNESVERQQLELSLIGRTISESEALRMQYQLTAALKAEAAKNGVAVDEEELRLIEEKARAYGQLAEQIAATNILRGQQDNIEQLRLEVALVGQSDEVRRRSLALLQAEQEIRSQGVTADSAAAAAIRRKALAIADQTAEVERLRDAWGEVQSAIEGVVDGGVDRLLEGDFGGALDVLKNEIIGGLTTIGIKNPLANALDGGNRGTLSDLGGLGGIVGRLIGGGDADPARIAANAMQSVGAMNVTAASVVINGGLGDSVSRLFNPANSNIAGGLTGSMAQYAQAIQSIESGRNYGALGPVTANGDRAYGAYQMMGANIGPWSMAALGRSVSAEEFLRNPSLQDQIFNHRFGGYVNQYGATGAAKAWFGGPGAVSGNGMATDMLGTSVNQYAAKFNAALAGMTGNVNVAGQGLGVLGTGFDKFGSALSGVGTGGAPSGGGGLFGNLFSGLFGTSWNTSIVNSSPQVASAISSGTWGLWDKGGYTGPGGVNEPRGIVHAGEIIWSQDDVARHGGVANVEAMRTGTRWRGYANGGVVGGSASRAAVSAPAYGGGGSNVSISVHNYSGQEVRQEETTDARGNRQVTMTIGEQAAAAIRQRGNPARAALAEEFGLKARGIGR